MIKGGDIVVVIDKQSTKFGKMGRVLGVAKGSLLPYYVYFTEEDKGYFYAEKDLKKEEEKNE